MELYPAFIFEYSLFPDSNEINLPINRFPLTIAPKLLPSPTKGS